MRFPCLLILTLLLAAPVIGARHTPIGRCDSGNVAFGIIQISDGIAEHTVYVDDRNMLFGNGVWLYVESNGIFTPYAPVDVDAAVQDPGPPQVFYWWEWVERAAPVTVTTAQSSPEHNLQRGGEGLLLDDKEICVDDPRVAPDLLIY